MKLTPNSFFEGKFVEVELNAIAKKHNFPANKPWLMQEYLNKFKYVTGLNTFGGYGEDRRHMWKGTYIEESKKYYHLGIDINVPVGTPVKCPFDCYLTEVFNDEDMDIGWGTRIILMRFHSPYLLVLGHLNKNSEITSFKNGMKKKKGQILGHIGTWPTNGNVFQHLHVQAIKVNNIENFDGYGFKKDLKDNPNPFKIEW